MYPNHFLGSLKRILTCWSFLYTLPPDTFDLSCQAKGSLHTCSQFMSTLFFLLVQKAVVFLHCFSLQQGSTCWGGAFVGFRKGGIPKAPKKAFLPKKTHWGYDGYGMVPLINQWRIGTWKKNLWKRCLLFCCFLLRDVAATLILRVETLG